MKRLLLFILLLFVWLQMSSYFLQAQNQDPAWVIEANNPKIGDYFGITSANGVIGLVSDRNPLQTATTVLNGVYDDYGRGRVENILKAFTFTNIWLDVDGQRIGLNEVEEYSQRMDLRYADFQNDFIVPQKVHVQSHLMTLRHLPYTSVMSIEIKALADINLKASTYIQAPDNLREVKQFYSVIDRPHVQIPLLTSVAKSPTNKHEVAVSNTLLFEEDHGNEPELIHEDWDYNRHWLSFKKTLKKGQTYRFYLIGSISSDVYAADAHNEAERLTIYAHLEGMDRLMARHKAAWDEIWESDIVIEGDQQMQQEVRSMLYHLYAFSRADTDYSLSPMGLSGLGYNGHVFWDTEIWMYPPLLMMQPEMAKSTLMYRFNRQEAARENAFSHGYKGLMFPWESAETGQEVTPVWALTGPFQHHISADVAWSHWQYYRLTQDQKWLATYGYPILKEVADFWVSRVEPDEQGNAHIRNVIGANEYAENIDNNAFTNAMAKLALEYAAKAAEVLGLSPNPAWRTTATKIPIERFEDGTTRENSTYQRGELIKQADANLLSFPLRYYTDRQQIEKDLAHYEQVMDPRGPAMGFSVLAAIKARLGRPDEAYDQLIKAYRPNFVLPFQVISETAGGTNPYFATGAGGVLQAIIGGFAGLELTDAGLVENGAQLPKHWNSLTIKGVGPNKKTFYYKQP